jgi:cobalamin biosynthesis protein CbiG
LLAPLYQDAGANGWRLELDPWPSYLQDVKDWPSPKGGWAGVFAITDRWMPTVPLPTVVFRPRSLALGIKCATRVSRADIERIFEHVCATRGFSPRSLGVVDAYREGSHPGIEESARDRGVPVVRVTKAAVANDEELVARVAEIAGGPGSMTLMAPYGSRGVTAAITRRCEDA